MFIVEDNFKACPLRRSSQIRPNSFKGPSRVVRLCVFGVLLPTILIAVPLYLRYRVYSHQLYPLAMSDMRIIDARISTMWCQRQKVWANTTFNAFLLSNSPQISERTEPVSMVRQLLLEDDMKEYWGFYLLKGSTVKVSTCVRWPGASLIVIRGHKHLHECAYIGDNSSEEADEAKSDDGPANRPTEMRRHRPDVQFSQNHAQMFSTNKSIIQHPNEEAEDTEDIKSILVNLQKKTRTAKKAKSRENNQNYTQNSDEVIREIFAKLQNLGDRGASVLERLKQKFGNKSAESDQQLKQIRRKRNSVSNIATFLSPSSERNNVGQEQGLKLNPDDLADHRGKIYDPTGNDMSKSEFWSSFSSSEESLLNCAGLILNLPLTPHHKCSPNMDNDQTEETYVMNSITYKVPLNGYYFFVFNSENEVQQNYLRVEFRMEKTVYDVSKSLASCSNTTENCTLDLGFLSSQKVVLELPSQGQEHYNDAFVAESECEPRTALYALCVIAVPVVFLFFAFT